MSDKPTRAQSEAKATPQAPADAETMPKVKPEEYFRVRFAAKSSPNDPNDVTLICQGDTLIIQREVEVTLPERFVNTARDAKWPQYEQKPGHLRKIIGTLQMFPFEVLGPGKREDFLRERSEGTKATREALERALSVDQAKSANG